jgi:hypothetical protein
MRRPDLAAQTAPRYDILKGIWGRVVHRASKDSNPKPSLHVLVIVL